MVSVNYTKCTAGLRIVLVRERQMGHVGLRVVQVARQLKWKMWPQLVMETPVELLSSEE